MNLCAVIIIEDGEKPLGSDHPDVATRLNNRVPLLTVFSSAPYQGQRGLHLDPAF